MIKVIELFAGIGSQTQALKNQKIPHEIVGISEWSINSIISYGEIHGETNEFDLTREEILEELKGETFSHDTKKPKDISKLKEDRLKLLYKNHKNSKNLGSIMDIKGIDVPAHDLLTYSFPCFTKNTLVLTQNGYKKIIDITVNDRVLTHTNTFKHVINTFEQGKKEIWEITGSSIDLIETTENHRFLTRTKILNSNKKRSFTTEPEWKETCNLTTNDYLGIAINNNEIIPDWDGIDFDWSDNRKSRHKNELSELMDNGNFWWIIGRYIGDEWERQQGGIIICCNKTGELSTITDKLDNINMNYNVVEERTTYKIHLPKKELSLFVSQFGKYAHDKKLTNTILDLPKKLLKKFVEGYHSADGSISKNLHRISSVSRELIYGIGQCIAKVYNVPYFIYKHIKPKTYIIEDREVNQRTIYEIKYNMNGVDSEAFFENNYIWFPIRNIINTHKSQLVYDIEVETDHSFTANGCIAHNCQDISNQGKQKGLYEGTSSSLLWQVGRLLDEVTELPKFLLMENVSAILNNKHKDGLNKWKDFLTDKGYNNYIFKLKASKYGIPQNRERVFMISSLIENKDLEDNIRKEEVMTDLTIRDFISGDHKDLTQKLGKFLPETIKFNNTNNNIRSINLEGYTTFKSEAIVYSLESISPTITATGANSRLKIFTDEKKIIELNSRELWKLMGFKDDSYNKVKDLHTEAELTKEAGNSIVVNVLEHIFKNIPFDNTDPVIKTDSWDNLITFLG